MKNSREAFAARNGEQSFKKNRKNTHKTACEATLWAFCFGAGYEARTRHLLLGKQTLYQMS